MRWIYKRPRRGERWRAWFAWRPVVADTPHLKNPARKVWVWLEVVERRRGRLPTVFKEQWLYRTRGGWGVV